MMHSSVILHRRSTRLAGYDYSSPGAYFITLVTYQRACLFGQVWDGELKCSRAGYIIAEYWQAIPDHFPYVELGALVVMPNHMHGILIINDEPCRGDVSSPDINNTGGGTPPLPYQRPTLGQVVAYYKYQTTKQVNIIRDAMGTPVWQRNYYDHILRNEIEHSHIVNYIESNIFKWEEDEENPIKF